MAAKYCCNTAWIKCFREAGLTWARHECGNIFWLIFVRTSTRWFVNENCSWQAFCLTDWSLCRGHRNQRPFHLEEQPKLGPYVRLQGHWRHPTPSSRGLQLGQGPNNSQWEHTCSDSHAPLHTRAPHVNMTLNARAYGVHRAHVQAFLPTRFPVHKHRAGKMRRQGCKHTHTS